MQFMLVNRAGCCLLRAEVATTALAHPISFAISIKLKDY